MAIDSEENFAVRLHCAGSLFVRSFLSSYSYQRHFLGTLKYMTHGQHEILIKWETWKAKGIVLGHFQHKTKA